VTDGARLSVDVVEVNPPLIVWLLMPIVRFAREFGFSPIDVFRVFLTLLICSSVILDRRLLRPLRAEIGAIGSEILTLLLIIVLMPWSRAYFGEREHITLILVLPYFMLSALRASGEKPHTFLSLITGVAAGLGFALKPHFAMVWIGVLVYLAVRRRIAVNRLGLENGIVGAVLLLYPLCVATLTPQYLTMVRQLGPLYLQIARKPVDVLLGENPEALFGLTALLGYGALRGNIQRHELIDVLAIVIIGFIGSVLLQGKGFGYHYYPVSACGLVLSGVVVLGARRPPNPIGKLFAWTLGLTTAFASVAACVWSGWDLVQRHSVYSRLDQEINYVRAAVDGGSLLRLTYEDNFPLVNYAGVRWASRYPHLWFLQVLYSDRLESAAALRYRRPEEMGSVERLCLNQVVEDFVRGNPALVMIVKPQADDPRRGIRRFDYLAYFSQDQRFTAILSKYTYGGDVFGYRVYRRLTQP
jgi:hypothetical protein